MALGLGSNTRLSDSEDSQKAQNSRPPELHCATTALARAILRAKAESKSPQHFHVPLPPLRCPGPVTLLGIRALGVSSDGVALDNDEVTSVEPTGGWRPPSLRDVQKGLEFKV